MKYIIMCGGNYSVWKMPRQLVEINKEPLVVRTIRLLRECGIDDIAISTNNPAFTSLGVEVLQHNNYWEVYSTKASITGLASHGSWLNAFYPANYPVCYLMGDVVFSPNAIKTIVETQTDDIQFFASSPPFSSEYLKPYAEPFAFKVVNTERFHECVELAKSYERQHLFKRDPIAWELWQVIKNTPLNQINYENYIAINDYTCDIDAVEDIEKFKHIL